MLWNKKLSLICREFCFIRALNILFTASLENGGNKQEIYGNENKYLNGSQFTRHSFAMNF